MPYTKTDWVEGVTKLGPTNMNHLETGVDDATETADNAIPKSVITSAGDLLYGTGTAAVTRLAVGNPRYMLMTNAGATAPSWVASPQSLMTGTGDMLYSSAGNTPARLAAGTNGQLLTMVAGVPAWAASTGTVITSYAKTSEKDVNTTVTKTDLLNGEITIGAGVMSSSGAIVMDCGGDLKNSAGNHKITLELKLGSTVLWDSNASTDISASANDRAWSLHCVIQALAATNAQRGSGYFWLSSTAAATTGTGSIDSGGSAFTGAPFETVVGAEDTTGALTLTLSVTLSAALATLRMRLHEATIRVF